MRYFTVLILCLMPLLARAQVWEDQQTFGAPNASVTLRILSSTDTSYFAPILQSFLAQNPTVSIEYLVTGTADLDRVFRATPDAYDVVISSAMDLQLKLANDGFAAQLSDVPHPDWAHWRNSLFAFTSEPAAIVLNTAAFEGLPVPSTRQELIEVLRENREKFNGKVGTYDVRQSGLGYLLATQDARVSETFWRLMEVIGTLDAQLYCCSGDMIDDLASGRIIVAYNVLGSYASARSDTANKLSIVMPSDFPTTMMRTALTSRTTAHPELAKAFVLHLTELQSNGTAADLPLPPLGSVDDAAGRVSIALEPALMTYLDTLKRRTFIREWESAVIQRP